MRILRFAAGDASFSVRCPDRGVVREIRDAWNLAHAGPESPADRARLSAMLSHTARFRGMLPG